MTSPPFSAQQFVDVLRDLAAQVQEAGEIVPKMRNRLEAYAVELATRRVMEPGGANLARDVLAELRRHIEEQDTIAARTPALAQQPGWDARMMFLRDAVEAIEARRIKRL
ncbi:hypothetical protein [Roseomonas sp. BN140053]|uniref:hypothetical protein n=1 Tax=Roseomonas sp. BN140053 TaxID=3391898 RepID=UPI0039EBA55F